MLRNEITDNIMLREHMCNMYSCILCVCILYFWRSIMCTCMCTQMSMYLRYNKIQTFYMRFWYYSIYSRQWIKLFLKIRANRWFEFGRHNSVRRVTLMPRAACTSDSFRRCLTSSGVSTLSSGQAFQLGKLF